MACRPSTTPISDMYSLNVSARICPASSSRAELTSAPGGERAGRGGGVGQVEEGGWGR